MNAHVSIKPLKGASAPGLLTASAAYKPFRYPWAFDMWKKQQ
ncbi:MAG TPA: ribonucleotide-diphosphate reductase subunit beta, partial [Brevundimonas sp.]|nr:ribonucleotide-diphosphate reductase subunit beta [Brevundimonas sp.]